MHSRGFTLVELVLVIVILGILAAVVGPRFFDRRVYDERRFFEETLSAVRYAQKLALASGCRIRVQVDADGYALRYASACGSAGAGALVADPGGDDFVATVPPGVTVTQGFDATFNSLGCVADIDPQDCASDISSAEIGGHRLKVHGATGFVEVAP